MTGSLWVATEAGLFRGEHRLFGMSFKPIGGLGGFAVHSLRRSPNGDLWIGTETRGAARIDARTGKAEWFGEEQGLIGKAAYTLRFDREHRLWVATESGLFMAKAPYRRFSQIAELRRRGYGRLLKAQMARYGLEALAGSMNTQRQVEEPDARRRLEQSGSAFTGRGPNGVVWVGYRFGGGIDRIHPQAGGVAIEKGVQRSGSDGLIYFLDFDAMGRLWAGTERGVDMWDGAAGATMT